MIDDAHSTDKNSSFTEEEKTVWEILETVPDPEVPVLSVVDLGVVRNVKITPLSSPNEYAVEVDITPTYSGCPAMDMIAMTTRIALLQHGYKKITINHVLSPAWTTDWMSEKGKQQLKKFGIAPPVGNAAANDSNKVVPCPLCDSKNTHLISQFGSTSCKALYQCDDCKEPFDYFKCH